MSAPIWRDAKGVYRLPDGKGGDAEYASVTAVCSTLAKPALIQWAANCAADKALALAADGVGLAAQADTRMLASVPMLADHRDAIRFAHREASEAARDRGSRVHDLVARIGTGVAVTPEALPDDLRPFLEPIRAYVDAYRVRAEWSERTVVSRRHGYAGTLDGIHCWRLPAGDPRGGRGGTCRALVDVKTCASRDKARVYPEHALQLAAYRYADAAIVGLAGEEARLPRVTVAAVVHLWPGDYRVTEVRADRAALRAFLALLAVRRWRAAENGDAS